MTDEEKQPILDNSNQSTSYNAEAENSNQNDTSESVTEPEPEQQSEPSKTESSLCRKIMVPMIICVICLLVVFIAIPLAVAFIGKQGM